MSIKTRLLLLVFAVGVITPAVVGTLALLRSSKIISENLTHSFEIQLKSIESALSSELKTLTENINNWSKLTVMQDIKIDDDDLNILSFLVSNQRTYSLISDITVMNADQEIIASTIDGALDWSDDKVDEFITNYQLRSLNPKYGMIGILDAKNEGSYIATHVIDVLSESKTSLGILLVRINMERIREIITSTHRADSIEFAVNLFLSSNSRLIIEDLPADQNLDFLSIFPYMPTTTNPFTTIDVGDESLAFSQKLLISEQTGLSSPLLLSIAKPEKIIYQPLIEFARDVMAMAVVTIILALMLGLFIARSIGRPLQALRAVTEQIINSNDLKTRVEEKRQDEIGNLGKSFNRLLAQIEESNLKLEQYNQDLEKTVAERTEELSIAKGAISEMLDHMKQAVMTFDKDLLINEFYSEHVQEVLGEDKPADKHVLELIFPEGSLPESMMNRLRFSMATLFGTDDFQWDITEPTFPKELIREKNGKEQILKTTFVPIYNEQNEVGRIMLILEDITLFKELQKAAEARQKELEQISDLLAVDASVVSSFITESARILEESQKLINEMKTSDTHQSMELVHALFRGVHTIKGNAGMFKLSSIQETTHKMEDYLGQVRSGEITIDKDAIFAMGERLEFVKEEIASYQKLRISVLGGGDRNEQDKRLEMLNHVLHSIWNAIAQRDFDALEKLNKEADYCIYAMSVSSFASYFTTYQNLLEELAQKLGKKLLPLQIDESWVYFDEALSGKINGFLVHLLRNAADHGVEMPATRKEQGKNEAAQISLGFRRIEDHIEITLEDDGGGINGEALSKKAIASGTLTQEKANAMNYDEKIQLIFHSGLSTKEQVSEISGRGVGVDAVKQAISELGGSLTVSSTLGKGSCFTIRLPLPDLQGNQVRKQDLAS